MSGIVLRDAAEAAWDEDGATPSLVTQTPPVPRSEGAPTGTPSHPSVTPDVTRSRATAYPHQDIIERIARLAIDVPTA